MFEQPDLTQIERLDQVGNDLGVLKRHFSSYIRLIDRVIESSSLYDCSKLGSSQMTTRMFDIEDAHTMVRPTANHDRPRIGVNAGAAAYVRFERLKDMITLYALSEVEEYLERKQALVDMVSSPNGTMHLSADRSSELPAHRYQRVARRRATH